MVHCILGECTQGVELRDQGAKVHKDCSYGLRGNLRAYLHLVQGSIETEGGEEGQVISNISIFQSAHRADLQLCSVLGSGGRKGGGACTAAAQVLVNTHVHLSVMYVNVRVVPQKIFNLPPQFSRLGIQVSCAHCVTCIRRWLWP